MATALQFEQPNLPLAQAAAKPHILLLHQAFAGPDDPGGTRHFELLERLGERGLRATVITGASNYFSGTQRAPGSERSRLKILIAGTTGNFHDGYFSRSVAFLTFALSSFVKGMCVRDVDIVFATSPPLFQAVSSWLIAAIRRKPLVLEIRDLWPAFAEALDVVRNPLLIVAAKSVERFLYRRADRIIINSPAYREHVIAMGADPEKVVFVANGADPELLNTGASGHGFRLEHGLAGKFVVMYAGAAGLANDLPCLLRAAKLLRENPDVIFVFVCAGQLLTALQQEARRLELENVRFVPAQPKSRMGEVLAAADVCVATLKNVAALQSTYPNKVFDYMAAGKPVVLAIGGPIREVIETAECGIAVPPGDSAALADAIVILRNSPELRLAMGKAGRHYVRRNFNRQHQAEQLAQLLSALKARDAETRG